MRRVNRNIPDIQDVVDVIPCDQNEKNKLKEYLEKIDEEYKGKIVKNLYSLDIDQFREDGSEPFDDEKLKKWYKNHVRKKLLDSFPEVKNHNQIAICPFCEAVFNTQITLEHIIPKGEKGDYRLCILPINLIKCCKECNTSNHSKKSICKRESEINLYAESFEIENFIQVSFDNEKGGGKPEVKIVINDIQLGEDEKKRIKKFVENYKLEMSYSHRTQIELKKLLQLLKNNLSSYRTDILLNFLRHQEKMYSDNADNEKIDEKYWIDQNFFGYKLCEAIIQQHENGGDILTTILQMIIAEKKSTDEIVFSDESFMIKMDAVKDVDSLCNFATEHLNDLTAWYNYLSDKEFLTFPNLEIDKDDSKKNLVESIVRYYLESRKPFNDFKENFQSIVSPN